MMSGLWILNFSHPLTPEQKKGIRAITGQRISKVLDLKLQFDNQRSFVDQTHEIFEQVSLTAKQWQAVSILVNPPAFAPIACMVLAVLHGKLGYFPPVMRLRPTADVPPKFEVAEIINLQKLREQSRQTRFERSDDSP
ncbi:MAG: CRISPR-associated protein Csx15 [Thermogutta sp.]